MSSVSLDLLLEQARPLQPADDGFTEIVMQTLRARRKALSGRRRFITRPAVLATAAVLATGGALAAAVRTNTFAPGGGLATATTSVSTPAAAPRAAAREHGSDGVVTTPSAARSPSSAQRSPERFQNAFYEWGYTSPHSSYLRDKRTGLRVAVDTGAAAWPAARSRTVIVTVTNTTSTPVAISSQSGCAISAAAWAGPVPSGSSPFTRDPASAKSWRCASGADARGTGTDEFILGAHASRTQQVRLTLPRGEWTLAGVCRCDVVTNVAPDTGMTLDGLQHIVVNGGGGPTPGRLVTPPLAVRAG